MNESPQDTVVQIDEIDQDSLSHDRSTTASATNPLLALALGSAESETGKIMQDAIRDVAAKHMDKVLNDSKDSAKSFISKYTKIDLIRPYFDVEPTVVRTRLLQSLLPVISGDRQNVPTDMYGPVVLALTLVAILLLGMKGAPHTPVLQREGTLIGTSFAVSFFYWFSLSGIISTFAFVFNTQLSMLEILSLSGYGLFGYCLVLLGSHVFSGDSFYYLILVVIGSLSALRLALVARSRTRDAKQGWIVGGIVGAVHFLYLMYIHVKYVHPHA